MTPKQILKELAKHHEEPPMKMLREALVQEEALGPIFEEEIERYIGQFNEILDKAETDRQFTAMGKKLLRKPSALFYGFLLAAEWKRTEAFPHYANLLHWSWAGSSSLLSEMLFDSQGARIMAEIYNGDPTPIFELLLDESADESIRVWQWRTLILLVIQGKLDQAAVKAFVVRAFDELEQEPDQHVWSGWEEAIVYFGFDDLIPMVEQAYAAQRFRDGSIEEFREKYAYARAHPDEPLQDDPLLPFGDFEEEVEQAVAMREP